MSRYLKFLQTYSIEDNTYTWYQGVRYGIQKEDNNGYYIQRNSFQLYPIPKDLEFDVYTVESSEQDKKN